MTRHRITSVSAAGLVALSGAVGVTGTAAEARAQLSAGAKPRHATTATALSSRIRCPLNSYFPDLGCGRMKNGRLTLRPGNSQHAHIEVKDIDHGGATSNVRLIDVAGTSHKEAVVLISANAGGVSWPNYITVSDGNGTLLATWFVGDLIQRGRKGEIGGARETAAFRRTTKHSTEVTVDGIAGPTQCEACGTGRDVYRITKGKNGAPSIRLITRRK